MSVRGSDNERAVQRAILWMLVLTILFILYASLYPFEFDLERARALDRETWTRALTWRRPPRSDLIANLIFYLPFGALLAYLTPQHWGFTKRWLTVLASGTALSLTVECLQFTTRSRDPALTDIVINGLSALLGALVALTARQLGVKPILPELRARRPDPVAVLLVLLWLAFHAAPFMPSARFIRYFHDPGLLFDREWSIAAGAGFFAGYVLLGAALRNLLRPASFWPVLGAIVVVSLLSRIVFRGQRFDPNELLGLALALPVLSVIAWNASNRAYLWAAGWAAAALVMFTLTPFELSAGAPSLQGFGELELIRRTAGGEPGLLELTFLYGGFLWLLCEAGLPVARVTIWLLVSITTIELVQAWQPGRSAHLAAPLVTMASAVLIWARRRSG